MNLILIESLVHAIMDKLLLNSALLLFSPFFSMCPVFLSIELIFASLVTGLNFQSRREAKKVELIEPYVYHAYIKLDVIPVLNAA